MGDDPTSRTLRLLSLLSNGRAATPAELADALGSTERTVRRDVARLRVLGYTITARPGPGSAYALDRPSPAPVLLDGDDLVVLVSAVRAAAGRIDAAAADRVLAKLETLVPPLLRDRIATLDRSTDAVDPAHPPVDPAILRAVTDAVAEHGRLRFGYTDVRGRRSSRTADPARVIVGGDAWYLLAWDLDRDDWRVFRLDRVEDPERVPGVFRARTPPYESVSVWFGTDFGRLPAPESETR